MKNDTYVLFIFEGRKTEAQMVLTANRSGQIAVLSAFPLFLLDYLGVARINSELEQCNE